MCRVSNKKLCEESEILTLYQPIDKETLTFCKALNDNSVSTSRIIFLI